jgi:hypothetical protein
VRFLGRKEPLEAKTQIEGRLQIRVSPQAKSAKSLLKIMRLASSNKMSHSVNLDVLST